MYVFETLEDLHLAVFSCKPGCSSVDLFEAHNVVFVVWALYNPAVLQCWSYVCCKLCLTSGVQLSRFILGNPIVVLPLQIVVCVGVEVVCEVYSEVFIGCCGCQLLVV